MSNRSWALFIKFNTRRKELSMKKQTVFTVVLTGLFLTVLFAGADVNFSGTWVPDEAKMEQGDQGPRMVPAKIVVKQAGDSLSTERYYSNQMMGDFTVTEKLSLDGKECVSEMERGGTRTSTAVWSEGHDKLTINSTLKMNWNGQPSEMKSTEVWSLEDKDSVLKIESKRESPRGTRESTLYFKKGQ